MSPQDVSISERISVVGAPVPPSAINIGKHLAEPSLTPEQRLAAAVQRFHKRGCSADDARRRLRILNATLLDGAVPSDVFEQVFQASWSQAADAKSSTLPLVTFSTIM